MLISLIRKFSNIIKKTFIFKKGKIHPLEYWEKRARQYGKRAVLNFKHSQEDVESVTEMQKETIFHFLKNMLAANEKLILDFGCGPGRFTPDLV